MTGCRLTSWHRDRFEPSRVDGEFSFLNQPFFNRRTTSSPRRCVGSAGPRPSGPALLFLLLFQNRLRRGGGLIYPRLLVQIEANRYTQAHREYSYKS